MFFKNGFGFIWIHPSSCISNPPEAKCLRSDEKRAQDLTLRGPTKDYFKENQICINTVQKFDSFCKTDIFPYLFRKKAKCNQENKERETMWITEKIAK